MDIASLSNTMSGIRRMAGAGPRSESPNVELSRRRISSDFKALAAEEVKTGPVLENVFSGKDVDLLKFPAPKWHELDGGYLYGTGSCVSPARPKPVGHMGVYRVVVHDENTLGIFINHIHHAR